MNIQQLRYFLHVSTTQNMQQSADELFISQPALSKSISNLEDRLGTKLFDRVGRSIQLNKFGVIYKKRVYRALTELDIGEKELYSLTNAEKGQIDLGFVYSLGPVFIPNLLAEHSKISHLKFRVNQNNTMNLLLQLQEGKYDAVFFTGNTKYPGIDSFPDLAITTIYNQPVAFIVSAESSLSSEHPYSIEDLLDYEFITFHEPSTLRPLVNNFFAEKNLAPKITYEVLDDLTLLSLTSKNLGIGIFPKSAIMKNFGVREIYIKETFLTQTIYLAQNPLRYKSPAVKKFINYVKKEEKNLFKHI